jgi:phosphohistidine phosphatase
MKLLIIRHAIAANPAGGALETRDDAQRPLTKLGRRRMRRAAKAIAELVPDLKVLATSPLVRAVQTGEIIGNAYEGLSAVQIAPLAPRKTVAALLQWLQQQRADATVGLVGHEPQLGIFASWMMTGLQEPFVTFKKGGACLLEIDGEIKAGRAKLTWLLKPSHLRKLA